MKSAFFSHLLLSLYLLASFSGSLAAPSDSYSYDATPNQELLSNSDFDATHRLSASPVDAIGSVPDKFLPKTPAGKYFVQWLNRHAAIFEDNLCFYSGWTGKTPVYTNMKAIAEKLKCEWMESLLERARVQKHETKPWSWAPMDNEWKATSQALAENAKGTVKVILGGCVNPGAVWNTVEAEALKKLGRVERIEEYRMDAAGQLSGPILYY